MAVVIVLVDLTWGCT